MAKEIIRLICYISADIERHPKIKEKLNVVFLENYNVSLAEALVPSAEISEQISLAGKEASGTGCMKLMMNGALTIGTLDGANVEMQAAAGADNMYIFGLTAAEVEALWMRGYRSTEFYANNIGLSRIVNQLNIGFAGESFANLASYLLSGEHGVADPYLCLADYESYRITHSAMIRDYADKQKWNRMSLLNIAASGEFAADRSIEEYAQRIWNLQKMPKRN
jgi:starch phosphorylase